jgi:transposase InsO family protein
MGGAVRRVVLPWRYTDPEKEQVKLIQAWERGGVTVTWLAREFGLSRKSVYKRIERYREHGLGGLGDLSRAPHTHPNQTPDDVVELVLAVKRQHMTWGPKKVVAALAVRPGVAAPAASTAGEILKRAGLVRERRPRRRAPLWGGPEQGVEGPNDRWSADHKGWWRTGDGERCMPLTIADSSSRYLIAAEATAGAAYSGVRRAMLRAFREYGLPLAVITDNGPPFAGTGLGALTRLSAWWARLGIVPERTRPGHPEENGAHERMHRTLGEEAATPPAKTARMQQRALDAFRASYNHDRPHEALGQRTPASLYRPSPRPYPSREPEPGYPPDAMVRRVRTNGEVKWAGELLYISEALCGQPVGFQQRDDHLWAVLYGRLEIGMLDHRSHTVLKSPTRVLPMSPV